MRAFILFILLNGILSFACSDSAVDPQNGDPSNLEVAVEVSDDKSGTVTVTATAEHAVEYRFDMGDGSNTAINTDGNYVHVYDKTGTYTMEVKAYGESGRFIKKISQISVQSGDPNVVGQGYVTPTSYAGMNLVWNDEFDGTSLNNAFWSYEIGNGCPNLCGWGNNELEYYTQANAVVNGGVLNIEAKRENFSGSEYTSSRIITRDKKAVRYGRVDVRALLPGGQGIWPAIWMLGANQPSVGWPKCGEIDIMEMVGGNGREKSVHGTAHWDENGRVYDTGTYTLTEGSFQEEYHVFSIIWNEEEICYFVNDEEYHSIKINLAERDEFHKEFFFILNVAVGGDWPGPPNSDTVFPVQMKVDYIRVFQNQ